MEALGALRAGALAAGAIPPRFHYESWYQSRLWLAVAEAHAPTGLARFYDEVFDDLPMFGAGTHLVALGAGGGWKERALLERQPMAMGTAIDVSAALALLSGRVLAAGLAVPVTAPVLARAVAADVTAFEGLPGWLDEIDGGAPRVYTAFGLTPNLEPGRLLPALHGFLKASDWLLVSANLLPDTGMEAVLPEYDNAETRRWVEQVLVDWGIRGDLGPLQFEASEIDGETAVVASAPWREGAALPWEGTVFRPSKGERLRVFFSVRFELSEFERRLREAGFDVERSWRSDCGREGLALCAAGVKVS